RPAVNLTRIHLILQYGKTAPRQQSTHARQQRPGHRSPKILANLPRRTFSRLQRDISRKAFDHHHVDHALADLVAFYEPAIVDRKILRLLQPGMRLPDLLDALDLFDANVQEPDARPFGVE